MRILTATLLLLAPSITVAQTSPPSKGTDGKKSSTPTLGAYLKDRWQVNAADLSQAREFSTILISRGGEVRLCLIKADRSKPNGLKFITEVCVPVDPDGL